jgi:Barrel-sandwich domain of CusB or HlyD membrane-fusion
MKTSAPPKTSSGSDRNGRASAPGRTRRIPGLLLWGAPLLVLVLVGAVASRLLLPAAQTTSPVATPVSSVVAHGTIEPTSQARVGTLGGGVLLEVTTPIGTPVEAQRELARVRGPAGVEVLTAPFAGTVTGLLANTGDTLVPGAGVVKVADLNRLQVETNDVDEFLIGRVRAGQTVRVQIEALDRRELSGRVQTVALQPQTTSAGDLHYPVAIDIGGVEPDFRPGMSVRIIFPD